ncbi:hypothetical protein OROHE_018120 [Orobanche hederae]
MTSQEILKICDGTHLEAEEILTYIKNPRNGSVWYVSSKLDVPSNVVQKKRVTRILFFKIRPSQEILKIRDGTHLEAEEILTYIKKPSKRIVQKKRVARILFFKIRPSQEILKIRDGTTLEMKRVTRILFFKIRPSHEILKIRDGTHLEAEEILTYIKKPSKRIGLALYSKLDIPSNVVQKKRVARILFFKIRTSQEIPKICDGTPLEAEEILTYIEKPSKRIDIEEKSGTDSIFKIRPSQEILKIRDGTPLEAEEILTYLKNPRNGSVWYVSSKLDVPSNVVQKKRVTRILFFKIRPSQEILKIRDGTHLEAEEILTYIKKPSKRIEIPKICDVAHILFFKIRTSQEILKICDGTHLEAEEILTYIKSPRNGLVWHFSSKLDVPNNVVQKKRVARILFFKIRPSQEILKIRDGTTLEAEEIFDIHKKALETDWPSHEILKIRDGTHLEAEEILTYIKKPSKRIGLALYSKLDIPSNVVQKKRVARILFFKIRTSQEIPKICDGTPLEAEEILTYIKKPSKRIVARILFFKIRPSQEILKIRDGTTLEMKRVTRILFFKIRPSHEILKIRDGTHLEAEEILTYIKKPSKRIGLALYSKLDIPSNVVQKKRVARILFFKIRTSQEIPKICDGTPLEAEEILTYIEKPSKRIDIEEKSGTDSIFKIRPSQEILKIRDGTPLEAEEILTYLKNPRNGSVWYVSSKLDVPSNVVQKKRVTRILFFKIRPSQEILKIRDGTHLEAEEILTYIKKPSKRIETSQEILKICDGTHLEAEEILTYIKSPRNGLVWHFSSKLDVPNNVVQKKRVARILFFKIRPSQEILKIRDGTTLEMKRVTRILFFKIRPSHEILKIRDGTHLEAEEILTYIKKPSKRIGLALYSKLDIPSNVVQKKRVARILFFKIRTSQEIPKICDGTPLEAEEILTYIKKPSKRIGLALF